MITVDCSTSRLTYSISQYINIQYISFTEPWFTYCKSQYFPSSFAGLVCYCTGSELSYHTHCVRQSLMSPHDITVCDSNSCYPQQASLTRDWALIKLSNNNERHHICFIETLVSWFPHMLVEYVSSSFEVQKQEFLVFMVAVKFSVWNVSQVTSGLNGSGSDFVWKINVSDQN